MTKTNKIYEKNKRNILLQKNKNIKMVGTRAKNRQEA